MRLTALCIGGTLLAFSSLSWMSFGDALGTEGFNPCAATLTAGWPCSSGQATCPYVLSLPQLTVHLPEKLQELEKLEKELQTLKDDVDQLRKMCLDCGESERGCVGVREGKYDKGGPAEILQGTDRDLGWIDKADVYLEGHKEENRRSRNGEIVKEGVLAEEVPDGGKEITTKTNETKAGKTQTEGGDRREGIKDHGRHTSKDQGQIWDERRKEMERGVKVEGGNKKPKQPENIDLKSIKEGEDAQGKRIQNVQRDSGGQSSTATERTDLVGISPSPASTSTLHDVPFVDPGVTQSASVAPNLIETVSMTQSKTTSNLLDSPKTDISMTTQGSATSSSIISHHNLHTTISPEATEHSRWPAQPAIKHLPGLKAKPGAKHKLGNDKTKESKHDRKPDIKTKQEQKQKLHQKHKTGNYTGRIQIQRHGQRADNWTNDQNLKSLKPKHIQDRTTQLHQVPTVVDHQRPATGKEPDPPIWNKNSKPHKRPVQQKPKPDKRTKSDAKDKLNQFLSPDQEPNLELSKLISNISEGGQNLMESLHSESPPEPKDPPGHVFRVNPYQRLKSSQKSFHINTTQVPKLNQKLVKPKASQAFQTNQWLKEPRSDVTLKLDHQSVTDQSPASESKGDRPPIRPTPEPETATPKQNNTKHVSRTIDLHPTSGPRQLIADVTHSPELKQTSNSFSVLPVSPNSRMMSDLIPQATTQSPSIPTSTSPVTLHNVIPNNNPESSKPKATLPHRADSKAPLLKTSTTAAASTTSDPEPPGAESSSSSARELRVKINQVVAAFFNSSLGPNGRSPDRPPKKRPEDKEGGSRTASGSPLLIPSQGELSMKRDCSDHLLTEGVRKSGVYHVTPDVLHGSSSSFPVFCDMELHGGGWTLLQLRQDGSVSFNRTWAEYRSGFGDLLNGGEFWLGNQQIHLLTRDRDMMLRVDLQDFSGVVGYAEYDHFKVASERMRYRLTVGGYSGTAGDALAFSSSYDHNNRAFTTPDRDNDRYPSGNCGAYYSSGWWFDACMAANLNGRYYVGKYKGVRDGIYWGTWHNISTELYPTNERQSFKTVRMMIRPKDFTP
uniref:uncharacterized protein LOC131131413 n=1 Tax=Doryrhamphus excisus TaxID=161450 RepID=UPI0025AE1C38|nr:uncharacterized protein LOC131131413 [Doryrhamphus excisus]XP_057932091.1 uncharacterized protein LOC131131413 [Doryrhamphus excisus]XP_057932092.1 uncharacterized protein LOC131131413 [Doryrhamphus excisus]XP_057932093.1 uncharacterized protein LOC131131413 [Doryrhamphus excisus]XP_057932095.1 uncharacterized protein LOC131131413 [Doryrhamphus excisus]